VPEPEPEPPSSVAPPPAAPAAPRPAGSRQAAFVLVALVAFMVGFLARGWIAPPQRGRGPAPGAPAARADDDPSRGPADALVTVVEFSDFQCPFCRTFSEGTLPALVAAYGDRVRFVYRDFPLAALHPDAQKAAEAAQCAFAQGMFWPYHDRLFRFQRALDVAALKEHARAVGLNGAVFDACLDSGRYAREVLDDVADGRAYGVTGTPTFFINDRMVVGAQPFAVFQQVIEEELARLGPRR